MQSILAIVRLVLNCRPTAIKHPSDRPFWGPLKHINIIPMLGWSSMKRYETQFNPFSLSLPPSAPYPFISPPKTLVFLGGVAIHFGGSCHRNSLYVRFEEWRDNINLYHVNSLSNLHQSPMKSSTYRFCDMFRLNVGMLYYAKIPNMICIMAD